MPLSAVICQLVRLGVSQDYVKAGKTKSTASNWAREIRSFFEEPSDTLWVTFYNMKFWWAFANTKVKRNADNTKSRKVIGAWSDRDLKGNLLTYDNLRGSLTATKGYRGTICDVKESKYLLQKINCETPKEIIQANKSYEEFRLSMESLISNLNWQDFEILIDMIFREAGWQRMGAVGKQEKHIDLDLISHVTHERAFVQIKSEANFSTFQEYLSNFDNMKQFDKFFFVVHSTLDKKLLAYNSSQKLNLWRVSEVAKLVIDAGLGEWVIKKSF